MKINEIKEVKVKKTSIIKNIVSLIATFIITTVIVVSFRETIDQNETIEYQTNLESITNEIDTIQNKIITTQKSVEELESFIENNKN